MAKITSSVDLGSFLQELEEWKAETLGPYCAEVCQGKCCDLKRFYLEMTKSELVVLLGKEPTDWRHFRSPGKTEIYHYEKGWCPQYNPENRRCLIHEREDRPEGCRIFPFIYTISPKSVQLSLDHSCSLAHDPERVDSLKQLVQRHQVHLWSLSPI